MFTLEANFSNIVDDNDLYVSNVVHKAYTIKVDKTGTEATAATGKIVYFSYYDLGIVLHFYWVSRGVIFNYEYYLCKHCKLINTYLPF